MGKTREFNVITNKIFVDSLRAYVTSWMEGFVGFGDEQDKTWENNVEKVAKRVIELAEVNKIDLMTSCLQASCGTSCNEKCKDSFFGFMAIHMFATGELSKLLNLPKDVYDFEKLYDWQEFSLHCLLKPFYGDVYTSVKKIQGKKA